MITGAARPRAQALCAGLIWLWRKAGSGRGIGRHAAAFERRLADLLAVALRSPLHRLGRAHVLGAHGRARDRHRRRGATAASSSRPLIPFLWAMPIAWRRELERYAPAARVRPSGKAPTRPLTAWIAHAAVLWCGSVPAVFRAALASKALHAVQHLCFSRRRCSIGGRCTVPPRGRRHARSGVGDFSLFTTSVRAPLCSARCLRCPARRAIGPTRAPAICGLAPLEDQRLAGLMVSVPAGLELCRGGLVLMLRLSGRRNGARGC